MYLLSLFNDTSFHHSTGSFAQKAQTLVNILLGGLAQPRKIEEAKEEQKTGKA